MWINIVCDAIGSIWGRSCGEGKGELIRGQMVIHTTVVGPSQKSSNSYSTVLYTKTCSRQVVRKSTVRKFIGLRGTTPQENNFCFHLYPFSNPIQNHPFSTSIPLFVTNSFLSIPPSPTSIPLCVASSILSNLPFHTSIPLCVYALLSQKERISIQLPCMTIESEVEQAAARDLNIHEVTYLYNTAKQKNGYRISFFN